MVMVFIACEAKESDHIYAKSSYQRFINYARLDAGKKHQVVDNPHAAEIIIFAGSARPNYSDIRNSSLFKKYKNKAVILTESDKEIPLLPGLYTCLENKWGAAKRQTVSAGSYLRVAENDSLDINADILQAKYLFSFLGNAQNHPCRKEIMKLSDSSAYLSDTVDEITTQRDGCVGENVERGMHYRKILEQSKFILCPRGVGVSSWRLFETMRATRVPVIISDNLILPQGPRWDEFSLIVKEKDIHKVPEILSSNAHLVSEYSKKARSEWDRFFSKEVVFETCVDALLKAHRNRRSESGFLRLLVYANYLDPYYFRHWFLSPMIRKVFIR